MASFIQAERPLLVKPRLTGRAVIRSVHFNKHSDLTVQASLRYEGRDKKQMCVLLLWFIDVCLYGTLHREKKKSSYEKHHIFNILTFFIRGIYRRMCCFHPPGYSEQSTPITACPRGISQLWHCLTAYTSGVKRVVCSRQTKPTEGLGCVALCCETAGCVSIKRTWVILSRAVNVFSRSLSYTGIKSL